MELKPIEWPQLCALSRDLLIVEPAMPESEWRWRIKDRLAKWRFVYPKPETLTAAMAAVNQAHEKQYGPRPIEMPRERSRPQPPTQDDPPWRGRRRPDLSAPMSLKDLVTSLRDSGNFGVSLGGSDDGRKG